ncbi:MAG: MBL fold metallo-hydrolase [Lachnospiraceae bacterium]|nr:MBL fold metallo-hydrolase [Lachnospiraceae bacterium]
MAQMKVEYLVLGMVGTNCYLIQNTETNELIFIDPADNAKELMKHAERMEGKPAAILLTHGHFDHIMAADALRKEYNIPVYVHELDEEVLEDASLNLSGNWSAPYTMEADKQVKEGDVLNIAGFEIKVLHTPGHTQGSCCYHFPNEQVLVSGDTLFAQSYGRVDFPTSSPSAMKTSIKRLLSELPNDTAVLPGHEMTTSIAMEKRYNPLA